VQRNTGLVRAALLPLLAGSLLGQTLSLSTNTLTFNIPAGTTNPQAQTLMITASGANGAMLSITPTTTTGGMWLSVSPPSIVSPTGTLPIVVTVNPGSLTTGTYTGQLAFSLPPMAAQNVTVTVNLGTANTGLTAAPATLTFTGQKDGANPQPQTVNITGASTTMHYTAAVSTTSGGNWLSTSLGTSTGAVPGTLNVSVSTTGLAAQTYGGTVILTPSEGGAPLTIPVSLTITDTAGTSQVQAQPSSLTFNYITGGTAPSGRSVQVNLSGSTAPQTFTTAITYPSSTGTGGPGWLTISPSSGMTGTSAVITANPGSLAPGTYPANVQFSVSGSTPVTVPVTLVVVQGNSASPIMVMPATLRFFSAPGTTTAQQTITVTSSTPGVAFSASATTTSGGNWLSVSPASGTAPASLAVTVNPANLQAGSYSGSVYVTQGSTNYTVSVTLVISSQSQLRLSQTGLFFSSQAPGVLPSQVVNVTTTDNSSIPFSATPSTSDGGTWLQLKTGSTTTPGVLNISVDSSGLAAGTYMGTIVVSSPGASNSPQTITVTLTVSSAGGTVPGFQVAPTTLNLFASQGSTAPPPAVLMVTSATTGAAYSVNVTSTGGSWLSASPLSGLSPSAITVTANPFGLSNGSYQGTVTITAAGSTTPITVPVNLTVSTDPMLQARPQILTFNLQTGGSVPASRPVVITQTTGATGPFQVAATTAAGGNWLTASSTSGTSPGGFVAGLSNSVVSTLSPGTYNGTITVTSSTLVNSPLAIPVVLNVSANPLISVTDTQLIFNSQVGGATPATQTINVSSTGAAIPIQANARVLGGSNWLMVNAGTPTTPSAVTVTVNPSGLAPGLYQGAIDITSSGSGNITRTTPVLLNVGNTSLLGLSPLELSFGAGGVAPGQPQTISLSSTGAPVNFSATANVVSPASGTWLTLTPATGSTPGAIQVNANTTGLAAGTYFALIAVGPAGSTTLQYIPVSLTVGSDNGATGLSASPRSISFTQTLGQAAPDAQQLEVASASQKTFTVSATTGSGGNWLLVSSAIGTTSYLLLVSAASANMAAGTYSGSITLTPTGSSVSLIVPVTLTVGTASTSAPVTASPAKLNFSATAGASNPATQTIQVSSASSTAVNYTTTVSVSQGATWLQVTPASGQTPGSIQVTANISGLAAGTYNGNVVITPAGATSGVMVPVTLTIAGQPSAITASPTTLTFNGTAGGSNPAVQMVQLTAPSGSSAVSYTTSATVTQGSNWLQVTPTSGQTPGTLQVTANIAGLAIGTYNGNIVITPAGATSGIMVPVTLTLVGLPAAGQLTASPATLSFTGTAGGSNPAVQTVQLSASSATNYTASATVSQGSNWLQVSPTSGQTPGTLQVTANISGLTAGTYKGTITITPASGGTATAVTIPVMLTVM
jgi:Viral BACON domain